MKVLLLTGYYEPEVVAGLHLLCNLTEDLAANGCQVDVITPAPVRGIDQKTRKRYRKIKKEVRLGGRLIIWRVPVPFGESRRLLQRSIRYIMVTIGVFFKALAIKTDVIFVDSTPPTLGIIGAWLKRIKRVPALYNLQDIFPDSMLNTGLLKEGPLLKAGYWLEKTIYKDMDKIVVISEDFRNSLLSKRIPENKIDIVYNWIDEKAVVPVKPSENVLFGRYRLDRQAFYVTYCGNIGYTQNLKLLVDAAKELEGYRDIKFVIIGDGASKLQLEDYIKEVNAVNVLILPFQPYEDIAHVFSLGDVSMIISRSNIGKNSFPSKTWSIMSAGTAVLASFDEDSELCSIIKSANCGLCVPPDDCHALKTAILEFYGNRKTTVDMGINGREYIMDNLTRNTGTGKFYSILKDMSERRMA